MAICATAPCVPWCGKSIVQMLGSTACRNSYKETNMVISRQGALCEKYIFVATHMGKSCMEVGPNCALSKLDIRDHCT